MKVDEDALAAKEAFVWVEMARHFGELWTRRHGETDADGAWSGVLASLRPDQIRAAVRLIEQTWDRPFPPNRSEFAVIARSVRLCHAPAVPQGRRLAHLASTPERSAEGLAELRSIVGGAR